MVVKQNHVTQSNVNDYVNKRRMRGKGNKQKRQQKRKDKKENNNCMQPESSSILSHFRCSVYFFFIHNAFCLFFKIIFHVIRFAFR